MRGRRSPFPRLEKASGKGEGVTRLGDRKQTGIGQIQDGLAGGHGSSG